MTSDEVTDNGPIVHEVYEGEGSPQSELSTNPDIKVGDAIHYNSQNQLGDKMYKVICKEKGLKPLPTEEELYDEEEEDVEETKEEPDTLKEDQVGMKRQRTAGGKKTTKRKMSKRKMSKRKMSKRKMSKRKMSRRKN